MISRSRSVKITLVSSSSACEHLGVSFSVYVLGVERKNKHVFSLVCSYPQISIDFPQLVDAVL